MLGRRTLIGLAVTTVLVVLVLSFEWNRAPWFPAATMGAFGLAGIMLVMALDRD